jgi:pyruvate/2-oxoglutarate dehydrogenase complex dihydrolipoamide acyltransferase (E2) component
MAVTVTMPHLGETVTEGTILSWAKQPGETIAEDEVLLEISTDSDKVDTEVPSPTAGVIQEILIPAGQTVSVGTPLAVITEPAEAAAAAAGSAATATGSAAISPAPPPETPPGAEAPAPPSPEPEPVPPAAPPEGGSVSADGGDPGTAQATPGPDAGADAGAPAGQTWVTLREAELRTGVAMSTLRKWRKRHKIASRTAEGPSGMQVWVPLEAVSELAAQREARKGRQREGTERIAPTASAQYEPEQGPPQWAMQLLALADARAGRLLDRLAQAERERADAERDAAIERHKRERAEAEAVRLRDELATLTNPTPPEGMRPEPVGRTEVHTPYASFTARMKRWNDLRRRRA